MVDAVRWSAADAAARLTVPTDADDKYSRGVVGFRTGSDAYPGAAVLGVEAAWRTGVGMVRYLGAERAADHVLRRRPETVVADGRVQAWVIGSGTAPTSPPDPADASPGGTGRVGTTSPRPDSETHALRAILAADLPVIVDAGALDLAVGADAPLIATPHAGEFARLRARLGLTERAAPGADPVAAVASAAAALGHVVLHKGARTLVAVPRGTVIAVEAGTPWLAAAGTGDVLAGTIGALVAAAAARSTLAAPDLAALAATGAWLHGAAARVAAGQCSAAEVAQDAPPAGLGHPIVALDVAEALPAVIGALLARG